MPTVIQIILPMVRAVMAMPAVIQVILQMVRAVKGIPRVIQAVREMEVSYVNCYLLHN